MKYVKVAMTVALLAVLGVLIYFHISNVEPKEKPTGDKVDVVAQLLSRDIENNYPSTAREVAILFTDIQKCYYNEDINEEQLGKLAALARTLFDEKLLAENPYEKYYEDLKLEISEYAKAKRVIKSVVVDKGSDVQYVTVDGVRSASLNITYYLKENHGNSKIIETYILRKDEFGKWRIYGWDIADTE